MPRLVCSFAALAIAVQSSLLVLAHAAQAQTIEGKTAIRLGEHGRHVEKLRCLLEHAGFKANKIVDRQLFDPPLAWPVKQFQKSSGLAVGGNAGPQTIAALLADKERAAACEAQSDISVANKIPAIPEPRLSNPGKVETATPDIFSLQVYLDRMGYSPGEIDGVAGSNLAKAVKAYAMAYGNSALPFTHAALERLLVESGGPAAREHILEAEDIDGSFAPIPASIEEQSRMKTLPYYSVVEKLGEVFHLDPELLSKMNPLARFVEGETIRVPAIGAEPTCEGSTSVVVSKLAENLTVFCDGRPLSVFPVTVNFAITPVGSYNVHAVIRQPSYSYNPGLFGKTGKRLVLPPGPNGPVGDVWIAVDQKRGIGIHGTPHPKRISKNESHGCIRMTNWDARGLARLLKKGDPVQISH